MLTLMPALFTAWVARTASAISVPATKRPETRRPSAERSANPRSVWFSERRTKSVLSKAQPPRQDERGKSGEESKREKYLGRAWRSQKFVSQLGARSEDRPASRSCGARSRRDASPA